jgi:tetratricopeptide (TPR) repeat protein
MRKIRRELLAGVSLFLVAVPSWGAQAGSSAPAQAPNTAPAPLQTPDQATATSKPDHSGAYYHFMMARRYQELAGIYDRSDYVERAISEYKQAMEADPDSLFLRVNLAELYARANRVGDAVREAEAVLKVNPDQQDAHRLLANLYLHNLGETQPEKVAKDSLHKAIEHFEALTRLDPTDTDSYITLGRLYRLNNEPSKAEEIFRKALNADPNSRSALVYLAQLYSDQGTYDQAVELLKKIPESEMDVQTRSLLGLAYLQAGEFDNAAATYEKALAQEPENLDVRRAYAEALLRRGKSAEARTELQRVLKSDPEDGNSHLRLGQLDRQEGNFDSARKELERAKTLMPDNPEVQYQQVLLEDAVGNDDKAIEILQGLLKQSERPEGKYTAAEAHNRAAFLERLGLIYRNQEKYDRALETFRQMLGLGDSEAPQGEALIIETLRLKREPQKALQAADAAVEKYPKDRALISLRATLLAEQGHVDQAIPALQGLLNGSPSDRETYLTIAQVYSEAKRYGEAEDAVRKSLALTPKPEDQEFARFMLGSVYERQKKYDLAEEEFKKVLSTNPSNAAAANYLGYLLADRGVRLEESVQYIQKALQVDPNNGAYLDSLGWAYYKMRRFDLAQPPLEKAARLVSNDPTILEHLGHVYVGLGKKQQAQEEWERALKEWPTAVGSEFDAEQAAQLQKQLDELKLQLAEEKPRDTVKR